MSETFVLELSLVVTPEVERELDIRLEAGRQLYNACLAEALSRLRRVRESRAWQQAQPMKPSPERSRLFKAALAQWDYSEYALHGFAVQTKNACWIGDHLDVHVCQKIATRAFDAVDKYRLGQRGKPRFKRFGWMSSLEGKSNASGIRWRKGQVHWKGLVMPALFDPKDKYGVQAHGLSCPTKYVRLLKRRIQGQTRWYVQLVQAGIPLVKEKNQPGQGTIGLDIGPSSLAAVSEAEARLVAFCAEVEPMGDKIRLVQRQMDRSRRAMNPENYNPDDTVKKGVKLKWQQSGRYQDLKSELQEACRRMAQTRKRCHGELSNRIIRMGKWIKTEKLSYRSFQRNYGRNVARRAPGMFVEQLGRKAENAGGSLIEFSTRSTKLSQVCHGCETHQKKPLNQRWHTCFCRIGPVQRDLYSAFLATCVEENRLDISQAQSSWPGAEPLLWRAMSSVNQTASGESRLSSFGLSTWRQSCSYAQDGSGYTEALDAVSRNAESQGEVCALAVRTPWLATLGCCSQPAFSL